MYHGQKALVEPVAPSILKKTRTRAALQGSLFCSRLDLPKSALLLHMSSCSLFSVFLGTPADEPLTVRIA